MLRWLEGQSLGVSNGVLFDARACRHFKCRNEGGDGPDGGFQFRLRCGFLLGDFRWHAGWVGRMMLIWDEVEEVVCGRQRTGREEIPSRDQIGQGRARNVD